MKKYLIGLVIMIGLAVTVFSQPVKDTLGIVEEPKLPLDSILEEVDGEFHEVVVLAWAKINSKFMTVQEIKDTYAIISKSNYHNQNDPKFHVEENYLSAEKIAEISKNKSLQVILQSYKPTAQTPELEPESYMLVELAQANNDFKIDELSKEVADLYSKFNVKPDTTLTYTARIKGRITNTKVNELAVFVKDILKLENIEETSVADYYALNGYSKAFKDELVIAGKKRNFSLIIRYNLADDYSYIIFGTPDIGGQY